ncbi:MAG: tandem-95 repeat protein, partial [Planctomycetaceae bacterium]|nr:tandem-95 repeat protein [Planctomycetaceae bacterium]
NIQASTGSVTILDDDHNYAPIVLAESYQIAEDATLNVTAEDGVLRRAIDFAGESFTAVLQDGPLHGALTPAADGSFTYTPAADYFGTDSFSYAAIDASGNVSTSAVVTLNVMPVADAPIAVDDVIAVPVDTPVTFTLIDNDIDVDDDELSVDTLRGHAQHGAVTLHSNGSFTYTPELGYIGLDSFQYDVTDNTSTSCATVYLEIGPVITTVAGSASLQTDEDVPLDLQAARDRVGGEVVTHFRISVASGVGSLSANGIDSGASIVTAFADSSGLLTFTPTANFYGNAILMIESGVLVDGEFVAKDTTSQVIAVVAPPSRLLTATFAPVSEGQSEVALTLTLSRAHDEDITVAWQTVDYAARAGIDYTGASGTVTFLAGTTTASIVVGLLDDERDDDDLSFGIEFGVTDQATLTADPVEVTIADDDSTPTITIANVVADEVEGFAEFAVTLSAPSDRTVFVDWTTQDGTATGGDFVAAAGQIAFAAGETVRRIVVELVNDDVYEAAKSFQVTLTARSDDPTFVPISATANVISEDQQPVVQAYSTEVVEDEGFVVVTLQLSNPSDSQIEVNWAAVPDSAATPDDFASEPARPLNGTATFAPGDTLFTIEIPIVDDLLIEADETFMVELSDAVGAVTDALSNGQVTILDDESPRLRIADQEFPESAGVVEIVVELIGTPSGVVEVDWDAVDGTARAGVDYVLVEPVTDENGQPIPNQYADLASHDTHRLTFADGAATAVIHVRVIDTAVFEGDRWFQIRLSDPVGATLGDSDAKITILDDESVPTYLSELGVTPQNAAMRIPQLAIAEPPPPPATFVQPTFPQSEYIHYSIYGADDAVKSRACGIIAQYLGVLRIDDWSMFSALPTAYPDSEAAGTAGTTLRGGSVAVAADGSFSYRPGGFSEDEIGEIVDDEFYVRVKRDDGAVRMICVRLDLHPQAPDLQIAVPENLQEGEIGEITIATSSGMPVAWNFTYASYTADLVFIDSLGFMSGEVSTSAPMKISFAARTDSFSQDDPSFAMPTFLDFSGVDSFWGTSVSVAKTLTIGNAPPSIEDLSITTENEDGTTLEGHGFWISGKVSDPGHDTWTIRIEQSGGTPLLLWTTYPDGPLGSVTMPWIEATADENGYFKRFIYVGEDYPLATPQDDLGFKVSVYDGKDRSAASEHSITVKNYAPYAVLDESLNPWIIDAVDEMHGLWFAVSNSSGTTTGYLATTESDDPSIELTAFPTLQDGDYVTLEAWDDDASGHTTTTFTIVDGQAVAGTLPPGPPNFVVGTGPELPSKETVTHSGVTASVSVMTNLAATGNGFKITGTWVSDFAGEVEVVYRTRVTSEDWTTSVAKLSAENPSVAIFLGTQSGGPSAATVEIELLSINESCFDWRRSFTVGEEHVWTHTIDEEHKAAEFNVPPQADIQLLVDFKTALNVTQDPSRTSGDVEYIVDGNVAVSVREGAAALTFNPAGIEFAPIYLGAEQLYPIAAVETKLPYEVMPPTVRARLIIGNIVGDYVAFELPVGANKDTELRFNVPLAGKSLRDLPSGHYDYYIEFSPGLAAPGDDQKYYAYGEMEWLNLFEPGNAPYGAGWSVAESARLIYSPSRAAEVDPTIRSHAGITLFNGDGTAEWFGVGIDEVNFYGRLDQVGGDQWTIDGLLPGKVYQLSLGKLDEAEFPVGSSFEILKGAIAFADGATANSFIVDDRTAPPNIVADAQGRFQFKSTAANGNNLATKLVVQANELRLGAATSEHRYDPTPVGTESGFRLQLSGGDGSVRQFDLNGRLVNTTDLNGNQTRFTYHDGGLLGPAGAIKSIVRQGGFTTSFTYAGGELQSITTTGGRTVTYDINLGQVKKITAPASAAGSQQPVTEFDYDAAGQLTQIIRKNKTGDDKTNDQHTVIRRNGLTHRVSEIEHFGTEIGADDVARKVSLSESKFTPLVGYGIPAGGGNFTTAKAGLTGKIGELQIADIQAEARATYTDALGGVWLYQTDAFGYLTAMAKPEVHKFDQKLADRFKADVARSDAVWIFERDARGNVLKTYEPIAWNGEARYLLTKFEYQGAQLKKINYVNEVYDKPYGAIVYEPPVNVSDPDELWFYDEVTRDLDPTVDSPADADADPTNDPDFLAYYRLREHRAFYDPSSTIAAERKTTKYSQLDDQGRYTKATSSDGSVDETQFTTRPKAIDDLAGGLIDRTWNKTTGTTEYTYYGEVVANRAAEQKFMGLLQSITYGSGKPEAAKDSFTYDDNLHVDKAADRNGVETDYDYDALARLLKKTSTSTTDTPALVEASVYDGVNQVVRSVTSAGYTDPLANALAQAPNLPAGARLFHYDTRYEYDGLGRITREEDVERGAITQHSYSAITHGMKIVLTSPRPGAAGGTVTTTYYYDSRNQLTATINAAAEAWDIKPTTDAWNPTAPASQTAIDYTNYDQGGLIVAEWTAKFDAVAGADADDRIKILYSYDQYGRLTKVLGPDPDFESNAAPGELPRQSVTTTYRKDGQIGAVTTGAEGDAGRTTKYDEAPKLLMQYVTDAAGEQSAVFYDYAGRVVSSYDRRGNETKYDYDRTGRLTSVTDAAGFKTQINYFDRTDGKAGAGGAPGPDGVAPGAKLTAAGAPIVDKRAVRIEKITDGRGLVTYKQYDALGRLVRIVHPDPDGERKDLTFTSDVYRYNADGTLAAEWQEYGVPAVANQEPVREREKKYEYDDAGRLKKVTDALGTLAEFTYDALDNALTQTTATGLTTKYDYDALGRQTTTEQLAGAAPVAGMQTAKVGYDLMGNVAYTEDQYGDKTFFAYDRLGRTTAQLEPDYSFQADGNENAQSTKLVQYAYDDLGNLIKESDSQQRFTAFPDFDPLGRAKQVDDGEDGGETRHTKYEYDAEGNVTKLTDPDGNATIYEYDELNRVRKEIIVLPDGQRERIWQYDGNGNLIEFKDRDGRITVYEYDGLNRRIRENAYLDEASRNARQMNYSAEFGYDQAGNLLFAIDSASRYDYSKYDVRGRAGNVMQTLYVGDSTTVVTFAYTYHDVLAADARKAPSATSGYTIRATDGANFYYENTYQFDSAGREVFAAQDTPDANDKHVERSYGFSNTATTVRYDEIKFSQAVQAAGAPYRTVLTQRNSFEIQDAGLLRTIDVSVYKPPGDVNLDVRYVYLYDQLGQLRRSTDRNAATPAKNYDAFGRLERADGYSPNGNPNAAAGAPAPSYNRPTSINEHDVAYNPTGTVKETTFESTEYTVDFATKREYAWDGRNRLDRVTKSETTSTDEDDHTTVTGFKYVYDVFNNLIGKVTTAAVLSSKVGDAEIYVHERGAQTLTFEFDKSDNERELVSRAFNSLAGQVYAVDAHPVSRDADNNRVVEPLSTHWLTVDRQGNVRDSYRVGFDAAGNVEAYSFTRFDYEDWGEPKTIADSLGNENLFGVDPNLLRRFQGGQYDADIEAYKFGDRWLSTSLNRWLSEDPSGLRFGTNPYEALNNSPHNFGDPTGHEPISFLAAAIYTAWAAANSALDTGVEAAFTWGAAQWTGDESDWNQFNWGWTYGKHFGVNILTAGVGSKIKWGGKAAQWAGRIAIETFGDTVVDVGIYGKDLDDAFLANAVGNVGGDALGKLIKRGGLASADFLRANPRSNPLNYSLEIDHRGFMTGMSLSWNMRLRYNPPSKITSPSTKLQQWAQQGGYVDPRTNRFIKFDGKLAADHVYPQYHIKKLDGFDKITPQQQEFLLNYPGNFEPLPKSWNSSKLNRLADDWAQTPMGRQASKDYTDALRERQQAFEGFSKSLIEFWTK